MTKNSELIGKLSSIMDILVDVVDVVEKGSDYELELLRSYHKVANVRNDLITSINGEMS